MSDVKARHDKMVELVETMLNPSTWLRAWLHKGLPKAKPPDVQLTVDSPKRAAYSLLRVTGRSTMLYACMQTVVSAVARMERAGFWADRHRAAFKPERS